MLPFGKYKGESINEIYLKDKKYLQWLNTQPWFKIKFKVLHQQITKQLTENELSLKIDDNTIIIYTDGACPGNGTKKAMGGIGVHFSSKNKIKMKDLSIRLTITTPTNNKAELIAIEQAMKICVENKIKDKIIIFTDSNYSIQCITLWYPDWVKKNKLKGRKNIDILQRINKLYNSLTIEFKFINAQHDTGLQDEHSLGNKRADELAVNCLR